MLALGAIAGSPICDSPRSSLDLIKIDKHYFSTHAVSTEPTDAPANTFVQGGLKPFVIRKALAVDEIGEFSGFVAGTYGSILLDNSNGRLSELVRTYAVDGRRVRLFRGAVRTANGKRVPPRLRDCGLHAVVQAGGWTWNERDVRISLTDASEQLAVPVQQAKYGGKGGIDGGPELAGVTKPKVLGRCNNITPVRVDAAHELYQVNDGPMRRFRQIYDSGVGLSEPLALSSLDELLNFQYEEGVTYAHLDSGCFVLGSPPAGLVTCDVDGDGSDVAAVGTALWDDDTTWDDGTGWAAPSLADRTYVSWMGSVIGRILEFVSWPRGDTDFGWLSDLNRHCPEPIGIYLPAGGTETAFSLISAIVGSVCGWVEVDRSGALTGGLLTRSTVTAPQVLDDRQIVSVRRLDLPYGRPPWTYRIPYDINWTQMTEDQIAGEVLEEDEARVGWLTQPSRFAEAGDGMIRMAFPSSQPASVSRAFFTEAVSAEREATRRLQIFHMNAALFEINARGMRHRLGIGTPIGLVHPTLGITTPRMFTAVGFDDPGIGGLTVTLFG